MLVEEHFTGKKKKKSDVNTSSIKKSTQPGPLQPEKKKKPALT